jgi:hypothetical protein
MDWNAIVSPPVESIIMDQGGAAMKRLACVCLAGGLLLAGDGNGIRPRGNATDYPAHETSGGITVAGAVIPPDECRRMFSADLDKAGYVVIEVAIYPENRSVDLSSTDFMLRIGSDSDASRAVSARTLAASLYKKDNRQPQVSQPIDVATSGTVGWENGRDPITGQRRSGVYTGAGVGVGTGTGRGYPNDPSRPSPTGRDRATLEQELLDTALPEGPTRHTVAGYLYFPKPSKKAKNGTYELTYYGEPDKIHLVLPPPIGR